MGLEDEFELFMQFFAPISGCYMALNGITGEMVDIGCDICPCIGSASVK